MLWTPPKLEVKLMCTVGIGTHITTKFSQSRYRKLYQDKSKSSKQIGEDPSFFFIYVILLLGQYDAFRTFRHMTNITCQIKGCDMYNLEGINL